MEAPPGVAQTVATLEGHLILLNDPLPQISSKRDAYGAKESLYTMQASSGFPISTGLRGGPCACSESGDLSKYPVARESQKFPPKKRPWVALYWSGGK